MQEEIFVWLKVETMNGRARRLHEGARQDEFLHVLIIACRNH